MRIVFEKVPDSAGSSFGCFHAGGPIFDCPYHIHPEIEVLHILSGRGLLVVGDHIGRFAPGDLLLLGSGLPHMLCSDPLASDSSEATHIRYAQFKRENFGDAFWQMPEQRSVTHLLAQSARGLRFAEDSTPRLLSAMDHLWETFGARRLWTLMDLLAEMASLRDSSALASVGYAPVVTHRDSERLNGAIQYMNSHLTSPLQLTDVARAAGLSPQAFSRFFHKFMGIPFVEYVSSLRISLACRYLLETDRTIASICYLCGFNNLSNFNRQFLRYKAMTPKQFKCNGANENADSVFFARALPGSGAAPIDAAR
jgi:AraC-like DNA-binding protein